MKHIKTLKKIILLQEFTGAISICIWWVERWTWNCYCRKILLYRKTLYEYTYKLDSYFNSFMNIIYLIIFFLIYTFLNIMFNPYMNFSLKDACIFLLKISLRYVYFSVFFIISHFYCFLFLCLFPFFISILLC
jgi:hypothetical protein